MNTTAITQLLSIEDRDQPQIQLLYDLWLLTIFAVLLAIALPWFMSSFDIDFAGAAWAVLALGAIQVALTSLAGLAGASAVWANRARALLHATGVVVIGIVWQHAGGLQNPMFLAAFALPVIGASFISRWQPYVTAILAILVVVVVALSQAPELRWYATGLGTVGAWLAAFVGEEGAAVSPPFPGFYAPSGYGVVLLEVFAILLLACAVAAEYLGSVYDRLHAHLTVARAEAERGQQLWTALISRVPVPALLIDADTLQVICASDHLAPTICPADTPVVGRGLFESIRFSYPDVVQELITGAGGVAFPSMIRVADQLRATEVRVQHVAHKGRRFALVIIDDKTEAFCAKAALDAADDATLVVDAEGQVIAFNKPARGLFAAADVHAEAARVLAHPGSGTRWWEPGLAGRRKMHVEIHRRVYQVTSSTVPLPGEEESLYIVAFLPVARTGAANQLAARPTSVKTTLVQPR